MAVQRREFLKAGAAVLAAGAAGCAGVPAGPETRARVVVVGGGFGGATAAKYVRRLDPSIEVTLVEPNEHFVSCPLSNLVVGGFRQIGEITVPYSRLASRHGVRVVRESATAVDPERKRVRLASGAELPYDRVIVAPGVDFMWELLPALGSPEAQAAVPHAWKAGPQTLELRKRLQQMPDGGVYVLSIPESPYRCPPGPYERACQVAAYFKVAKPRSKVLVLDANPDVTSKGALFKKAWAELYPGIVEYRPRARAIDCDWRASKVRLDVEDVKGHVLNIVPPMKAGRIAAPFITVNGRWCEVDWLTYESKAAKGVHLVGDALQLAPLMPKSGHMANAQARICAEAVVALLRGEAPTPAPVLSNACYSLVAPDLAVHVTSVHKYDTRDRTMKVVPGSSGLSRERNEMEAQFAFSWARNIWADALA